jgi:hypothetical protein
MRHILGFAALAIVAGCASQPPMTVAAAPAAAPAPAVVAAQGDQPQQVCTKELPTGSTIPRTVCHTAFSEADRARMAIELAHQARPTAVEGKN